MAAAVSLRVCLSSPLSSLCLPSCSSSPLLGVSVRASAAMAGVAVTPAVIVGGGRVGTALRDMGDGRDVLIGRGQPVPADFDGPVLVCTRNDDLDAVLEATPPSRWNGTSTPSKPLSFPTYCYSLVKSTVW